MNQLKKSINQSDPFKETDIDYSQMYRSQETKQLRKRLWRTRIVLIICSLAMFMGGLFFWYMFNSFFGRNEFLIYSGMAFVFFLFSIYSQKKPYLSLISSLGICFIFWVLEIYFGLTDNLLIESSIQKLFIISLIVLCIPSSKEAELIRKELNFS